MAERQAGYPVIIDTQGEVTNPTTDVMADTGALTPGGIYEVLVVVSATALAEFTVQRRNAANGATVGDAPYFYCPANNTISVPLRFEVLSGERIRVMMGTNLTGTAVANVIAQKVA